MKTYLGAEISCICRGAQPPLPLGETTTREDEMGPGSWVKGPGFGFSGRASSLKRTTNAPENGGSLEIRNLEIPAFFGAKMLLVSGSIRVSKIHGFAKPSSWLLFLLGNCYLYLSEKVWGEKLTNLSLSLS